LIGWLVIDVVVVVIIVIRLCAFVNRFSAHEEPLTTVLKAC